MGTGLFLSYRDSTVRSTRFSQRYKPDNHSAEEGQGLIAHSPAHDVVDLIITPKWVDLADQVDLILVDVQAKITSLEKLHSKHVLPGFSDRSQEERKIEVLTTDITRDFRRCQTLIQKVDSIPSHSFPPSHPNTQHDALAAKNVQRGLAAKVQQLSATFRKKQRVYMEKLQGHAIKNQDLLVASGTLSLCGSEGLSAVDDDVAAATHTRSQSLSLTHAAPTLDIQLRNRELTEIANSIATLAELFKDLSALVIDQGTLLDSIEYNIEQTAAHVGDAVKELDVASKYQRNTGRRKCILLLMLIIFGLVVVLILKPKHHGSTTPPPPSLPEYTTLQLTSLR